MSPMSVADVEEAMRDVIDPELGINVVDLGLVYGVVRRPEQPRGDRHDADVGGVPADRRHRGPVRSGARGDRRRVPDQLGLDAAVGPGQDHRRRPRAAPRPGLQRLTRPTPPPGGDQGIRAHLRVVIKDLVPTAVVSPVCQGIVPAGRLRRCRGRAEAAPTGLVPSARRGPSTGPEDSSPPGSRSAEPVVVSLAQLLDSGPFRRADARAAGVGRRELERLEASGRVVRVLREVYLARWLEEDPAARAAAVRARPVRRAPRCAVRRLRGCTGSMRAPLAGTAPPRPPGARAPAGRPLSRPGVQGTPASSVRTTCASSTACPRRRRFARRSTCCAGRRPSSGWPPWTRWPRAWSRLTGRRAARRAPRSAAHRQGATPRSAVRACDRVGRRVLDAAARAWTPGCHGRSSVPFLVGGVEVYRLDCGYPELRVGFEYDGAQWHGQTPAQLRADELRREDLLLRFGWTVIGATSEHVLAGRPAVDRWSRT